jgi:hypothetical protein
MLLSFRRDANAIEVAPDKDNDDAGDAIYMGSSTGTAIGTGNCSI